MTNFVIACNLFIGCNNPLSMDGYPVDWMLITNNVGISVIAAAGFKDNIVLANNNGGQIYGGPTPNQTGIQEGHYMLDETNNNWTVLNEPIDAGSYSVTNLISYGNGVLHLLRASGSIFYLDDTKPNLIPPNAELQVVAYTWSGADIINFYTSAVSPGLPPPITNKPSKETFYWNGSHWVTDAAAE